ncbi:SoxR reducing system RseC family protein [Salinispirillum sp. LH 10-3-1]|uniref:SoxR reducing system RseC family protein n=1 Tax=Salinispirillum sp. LH 10-3-1 TaxID=2952525 RepID=A0AB38YED4_9GAMM
MIEEQATVAAIESGRVWVETVRSSACARCSARAGCGQSLMSQVISSESQAQKSFLPIATDRVLAVGQVVWIGIPETAFLRGAFWLYLLPLLALLAGALAFNHWFHTDSMALLGAVVGLVAGLWWARRRTAGWQNDPAVQPRILRVVSG